MSLEEWENELEKRQVDVQRIYTDLRNVNGKKGLAPALKQYLCLALLSISEPKAVRIRGKGKESSITQTCSRDLFPLVSALYLERKGKEYEEKVRWQNLLDVFNELGYWGSIKPEFSQLLNYINQGKIELKIIDKTDVKLNSFIEKIEKNQKI